MNATACSSALQGTLKVVSTGQAFDVGHFTTPSLQQLCEATAALSSSSSSSTLRVEYGDVSAMIADPSNHGATFQVASQFNCLEFVGPDVVPEDGITGYEYDCTQGPACRHASAQCSTCTAKSPALCLCSCSNAQGVKAIFYIAWISRCAHGLPNPVWIKCAGPRLFWPHSACTPISLQRELQKFRSRMKHLARVQHRLWPSDSRAQLFCGGAGAHGLASNAQRPAATCQRHCHGA